MMQLPPLPSRVRTGAAGLLAAALACAGLAGPAPRAQAAPASFCADGSVPMASVAEVEAYPAGTPVTGSSVVSGTTPSPFSGAYLGHVADALGKGKDLLLFQLSSAVIDGTNGLKAAGIWAGMSGSPVYAADGSLIGAVAYSLNYDNLPVAGVTPAEYMRTIGGSPANPPAVIRLSGRNLQKAGGMGAGSAQAEALAGSATLREVALANVTATSAQAAKLTNALLARVPSGSSKAAPRLRSKSFAAVGVAAAGGAEDQPLVAGGNIAALYSTGDGLSGSIGTVTAVCGDQVWAFGHPMDFEGRTALAMANASAAMIVPDATGIVGSYKKLTAVGQPQGTVTQDRSMGIKGQLGLASGYPVALTVRNAAGSVIDTRASTVVSGAAGPGATASMVANAVVEDLDNYYLGTLRFRWAISYRSADGDQGTIEKSQIYADDYRVADEPALDVGEDIYALIENELTDVEITGVTMDLTLLSEDSLVHEPIGAQYEKGATWVKLGGKTLKPGLAYKVRPLYRLLVNGKLSGPTIAGNPRTMTLSTKALRKGSLSYAGTAGEECDIEEDECEYEGSDATDFADLIAKLTKVVPNNRVTERAVFSRKGGSTSVRKLFTGPGVVEGTVKVDFKIG